MDGIMDEFEIIAYNKENGKVPVQDFIRGLSPKMQAKVLLNIELLGKYGNLLEGKFTKHINDGIYELRTKFASDITRVFYFFYIDKKIILTNGFIKKTQKTPPREIALAKKYRAEYIKRSDENEVE